MKNKKPGALVPCSLFSGRLSHLVPKMFDLAVFDITVAKSAHGDRLTRTERSVGRCQWWLVENLGLVHCDMELGGEGYIRPPKFNPDQPKCLASTTYRHRRKFSVDEVIERAIRRQDSAGDEKSKTPSARCRHSRALSRTAATSPTRSATPSSKSDVNIFRRTVGSVERALKDADITKDEVDEVGCSSVVVLSRTSARLSSHQEEPNTGYMPLFSS